MDEVVLDSSAIIAVLREEPGASLVRSSLGRAIINTVTLAEVVTKLADSGRSENAIQNTLADLDIRVVPFDQDQAFRAGMLRPVTRKDGLSLGDRACLALAQSTALTVLTADRAWADIPVDINIQLIR